MRMLNGKCTVLVLMWFAIALLVTSVSGQLKTLRPLAEWKVLEYEFPTEEDRAAALASQEYIPGTGVPIDNGVYYNPGIVLHMLVNLTFYLNIHF